MLKLGFRTTLLQKSRRFCSGQQNEAKKRIVFLGTPAVAAESLQTLYDASKTDKFEIVTVVTQPISGVQKKPSPVQVLTKKLGIPLLFPESAKDPEFLNQLENLNVDLCVTAAYGNFLPKKFLSIPKFGTVNIHPSLLPQYRGAAPVQRCIENGDTDTGVSVAFTVLKMDAGPIITQVPYKLTGNEKASQVLSECFDLGTKALLHALPGIFSNSITTTPQDDSMKSEAPKINKQEGLIDFSTMTALQIHNKCRAFTDWPGIMCTLQIGPEDSPLINMKIVTTVVLESKNETSKLSRDISVIKLSRDGKTIKLLRIVCGDGSVLGVLEVLPPGSKTMQVLAYLNGIKSTDKRMRWIAPEALNTAVH